jgi:hypothetical protein
VRCDRLLRTIESICTRYNLSCANHLVYLIYEASVGMAIRWQDARILVRCRSFGTDPLKSVNNLHSLVRTLILLKLYVHQ